MPIVLPKKKNGRSCETPTPKHCCARLLRSESRTPALLSYPRGAKIERMFGTNKFFGKFQRKLYVTGDFAADGTG